MEFVYKLIDPVNGEIRYVGKTKLELHYRLSQHIADAIRGKLDNPKNQWVLSLLTKQLKPVIEPVCMILEMGMGLEIESLIIRKFKLFVNSNAMALIC